MTAKRFQYNVNKNSIEQNGKHFAYCNGEQTKIAKKLNELHEENQELRLQLNLCSDQRNEFHRRAIENAHRVGKLEKENEQLKKDIKQIHTYIDNAILTERTRMGKNCLKQLKEGLQ